MLNKVRLRNWLLGGILLIVILIGVLLQWSMSNLIRVTAYQVAFSPSGRAIAAATNDGIQIWSFPDRKLIQTFGKGKISETIAWSPNSQLLASNGPNNTVEVWRVSDGALMHRLVGHKGVVRSVAFSPDGALLASGSTDHTIRVWRMSDGRLLRTLLGHRSDVVSIAFSVDGQFLASGSFNEGMLILWRVQDGFPVWKLSDTGPVHNIAFSPDGTVIASAGDDYTVALRQVSTGMTVRRFEASPDLVNSITFSPDGAVLAAGTERDIELPGANTAIHVWNVRDNSTIRKLDGHQHTVWSVAFSPDGKTLASSSMDGTIRFWQVK